MKKDINHLISGHDDERGRRFLPLILKHKERIYGYILTLVPRPNIAEDIMQETVLVMWDKFHTFRIDTNFYAWSKSIALNKVREYRRKAHKNPIAFFDEEVIDKLHVEGERESENSLLIERLESCLRALSKIDIKLIQLRFTDQSTVKNIAQSWGKTSAFVYREIARILYKLRECMIKQSEISGY